MGQFGLLLLPPPVPLPPVAAPPGPAPAEPPTLAVPPIPVLVVDVASVVFALVFVVAADVDVVVVGGATVSSESHEAITDTETAKAEARMMGVRISANLTPFPPSARNFTGEQLFEGDLEGEVVALPGIVADLRDRFVLGTLAALQGL